MLRVFLRFFFGRLLPIFYNPFLKLIAYGPWGRSIHQVSIRIYKKIYGLTDDAREFNRLGDFFLRDRFGLRIDERSPLVCPAESLLIEGPHGFAASDTTTVKGITYEFSRLRECSFGPTAGGTFWNFYLTPRHYHWVHAPCSGKNLTITRTPGPLLPVNPLGRWLSALLYFQNKRLSFSMDTEEMGRVNVVCVGALGVGGMRCLVEGRSELKKGERILAFEMGSSVVMTVEKMPLKARPFAPQPAEMKVGDALFEV